MTNSFKAISKVFHSYYTVFLLTLGLLCSPFVSCLQPDDASSSSLSSSSLSSSSTQSSSQISSSALSSSTPISSSPSLSSSSGL